MTDAPDGGNKASVALPLLPTRPTPRRPWIDSNALIGFLVGLFVPAIGLGTYLILLTKDVDDNTNYREQHSLLEHLSEEDVEKVIDGMLERRIEAILRCFDPAMQEGETCPPGTTFVHEQFTALEDLENRTVSEQESLLVTQRRLAASKSSICAGTDDRHDCIVNIADFSICGEIRSSLQDGLYRLSAGDGRKSKREGELTRYRFFALPDHAALDRDEQDAAELIACHPSSGGANRPLVIATTESVTPEARCLVYREIDPYFPDDVISFVTENSQFASWPFSNEGVLQFCIGHFGSRYPAADLVEASAVC